MLSSVVEETELTVGIIASTISALFADNDPEEPGSRRVKFASLPATSLINPLI